MVDESGRILIHGPVATQDDSGLWFLDENGVWHRHTDIDADQPIIVGRV